MLNLVMLIRWLARIAGVIVGLMVVMFEMKGGIPSAAQLMTPEGWLFLAMAVMVAGVVVAWRLEPAGAGLMILGFIGLWVVQGHFPGVLFGMFPLAGLLHLTAWAVNRESHESGSPY